MKILSLVTIILVSAPLVSSGAGDSLQSFLPKFMEFISDVFIPFLFGIAFLFFAYNAVRFFVIGGSNEDGREKARSLAIYGVAAFVLLITFWGIINLLSSSSGLDSQTAPKSDYVSKNTLGGGSSQSQPSN